MSGERDRRRVHQRLNHSVALVPDGKFARAHLKFPA